MSLITATSLSKSFGAEDIFRDVSLSVARGARLALVGPNGIGKTTLLRILVGLGGALLRARVTRAKALRIGYLAPGGGLPARGHRLGRVRIGLCRSHPSAGRTCPARDRHVGRGPTGVRPWRDTAACSRTSNVAAATSTTIASSRCSPALASPNPISACRSIISPAGSVPAPTWLDCCSQSPMCSSWTNPPITSISAAVEWLEGQLSQWSGRGGGRLARPLLPRPCLQLACWKWRSAAPSCIAAPTPPTCKERENRWNHRVEVFESERGKLVKDLEYIKKNIAGQNVSQAKGKLRRLTRIVQAIEQVGMDAVVSTNWAQLDVDVTTSPFSVDEAERRVRSLRPPVAHHPGSWRCICAPRAAPAISSSAPVAWRSAIPASCSSVRPDIELRRTDCAALIGPNGAGKSTLLKTVLGQLQPLAGEVVLGASLHIGYFAQAHEGLHPDNSVLDEILAASPGMLPHQGRDYLGRYLFSGDDAFKRVSMLSGGERGRLALAKLALAGYELAAP